MKTNQQTKKAITTSRRRTLAMARIVTNLRQLMQLDPSDDIIELIEQHTALLNSMYRHHVNMSAKESSNESTTETSTSECSSCDASDAEMAQPADKNSTPQINIPRKLKKRLKSLPDSHPLRRRYETIVAALADPKNAPSTQRSMRRNSKNDN